MKYIKIAFLLLMYTQIACFSWTVTPASFTLQEGKNPYYHLVVSSQDSPESVPIEVYAGKRTIDKFGNDTYERVEDKFFIYPSTFVLPPGVQQKIRIFWKGEFKDLHEEEAYRIIVEGLPVETKASKVTVSDDGIVTGIKVLKTYVTSLYINPKQTKAQTILKSHHIGELNGEKTLFFNLKNAGNKHILIKSFNMNITSENNIFEVSENYIKEAFGVINLLPKNEREFTLVLPKDFPENFSDSTKMSLKILEYK